MALVNRPKVHEILTGALLPIAFVLPVLVGQVIWNIADHPAAKICAFLFGGICFVALKTFYMYFSLLGIEKDDED